MSQSRRDFKAREDKIQTGGTLGSKRGSGKKEAKLDSAMIAKTWESFEREDNARDAARRVLHMNPTSGGKTSGHANRKCKEDTSTDEDEERLAESSRCKKRKKHSMEEPDMFDSDFKGQLSFSKKSSAKPVSTGRPPKSAGTGSSKTSKHLDDDSRLGSSLSEPKKSKKSRKSKSTGDPDTLQDELRQQKERQERADCDDRTTQALLVKYRPIQYGLEAETMKNYRSQHVAPG